jgi:hypothetical protein
MANQTIPSNAQLILVKDCGQSINRYKNLKKLPDAHRILEEIDEEVKKLQTLIQSVGKVQENVYSKWRVLHETVRNIRRTLDDGRGE